MIFELLRTYSVDVLRYLPQFLAEDPTFKNVQDTLSWEHEQYRLKIIDILKQFFVETATWGLADWERVFDLHPAASDSYAERRGQLKAKIQGAGTITLKTMDDLVNSVVPAKDAVFVENVAPGVCRVDVQLAINLTQIRQIVDTYKPAHLTCIISHSMASTLNVYIGSAVQAIRKIEVFPPDEFNIRDASSTPYIGCAVFVLKKIKIGGVQ